MNYCFQITYTSILTGTRKTYMNIGCETKESAIREKNRLTRDAKKYKNTHSHFNLDKMLEKNIHILTPIIRRNWRIRKVMYKI